MCFSIFLKIILKYEFLKKKKIILSKIKVFELIVNSGNFNKNNYYTVFV